MEKQQLLLELHQMAAAGQISRQEVLGFFPPAIPLPEDSMKTQMNLSEIMYYLGGAIVFLGISVLAYQNWDSFSSSLRILVTLGSSIACFITASLLNRYEGFKKLSQAFFLISGMLAPLGLNVAFKESEIDINSDTIQLLIYLILTFIFFGSLWLFRQTILLFFGIVFATGFFHFIINLLVGQNLQASDYTKIWEYRIFVGGLAWMILGYYFRQTSYKAITGALYALGVLAFLGSAMALGGWQPEQNAFWELIYPLLVFGVIFLSVYVKSKIFLIFGSLFLIGYILKLTGEYFSSGLGWPLALVLAGLVIMGVGYYAFRLNKKYFSRPV